MGNYSHPLLKEARRYSKEYIALNREIKGFMPPKPLQLGESSYDEDYISSVYSRRILDKALAKLAEKSWRQRRVHYNPHHKTYLKIREIIKLDIYEKLKSS